MGLDGVGFPRNWGRGAGAGGHGPALLAAGVLPVRAGAVTGSRVADAGPGAAGVSGGLRGTGGGRERPGA